MDNKVFADANILLELLLSRRSQDAARKLIAKNSGNIAISALTVHIVIYFAIKYMNLSDIKEFLKGFYILPLDYENTSWAFNHCSGNDYEDALQLSVAISNNCIEFITLDAKLVKKYSDQFDIKITLLK